MTWICFLGQMTSPPVLEIGENDLPLEALGNSFADEPDILGQSRLFSRQLRKFLPHFSRRSPVYRKTIFWPIDDPRKNGPSPYSRVFLVGANVVLSCWPSYSDPVEHDEPSRSAGMTLPPRTRQSNIKGILLIQGRLEVSWWWLLLRGSFPPKQQ